MQQRWGPGTEARLLLLMWTEVAPDFPSGAGEGGTRVGGTSLHPRGPVAVAAVPSWSGCFGVSEKVSAPLSPLFPPQRDAAQGRCGVGRPLYPGGVVRCRWERLSPPLCLLLYKMGSRFEAWMSKVLII